MTERVLQNWFRETLGASYYSSIKIKILANACRVLRAGLATPLMH